ncbi:MarR family winged helix-turn-helix transcriptional regulator [Saccharicrinis sp. FJH2]|uniref:MarR family winged helix-turn-helix transcriptional regulator n=1 Tax=Saccharicrinis sp. FJH65 TaxID=3344659 RepID=UPI0035F454F1
MDIKLDDIINHRISMLSLFMKRHIIKIIADNNLGITPEQWVILSYLWEEDGLSIGEIASRSKKDFANVTRIIDKLIKLGYVTKKRSERDGRIFHIYLQQKAEIIKNDVQNCWQQASEVALTGIAPSEQQHFMKTLEEIENNILNDLQ